MAAGLGFKTFTTGEVLTAADVNGYLMQGVLVFASAAARDAAITSPQEGQFAYTKDNNSLWYYTGSAWAASGATGDIEGVTAGVGISGGGTSGTVTITNSMATEISAKGDLIAGTGSQTFDNLTVGANNTVLTSDSSTATGLKWATPTTPNFVGCSVYKNTPDQTIANDTSTIVTYNAEEFDTDGFHDNSTNNSRITIPTGKGGKYLVLCNFHFSANGTGVRTVSFLKNGGGLLDLQVPPTSGVSFRSLVTGLFAFSAGDYIEVMAYQNSGGSLTLGAGITQQRFGVIYLGA